MIDHFSIRLVPEEASEEQKLNGYQLYACLLEMLDPSVCELLHENTRTPISQNVVRDRSGGYIWEINSFMPDLSEEIAKALINTKTFRAERSGLTLSAEAFTHEKLTGFSDIRKKSALLMEQRNIKLRFLTTTALKLNGTFLLFPDIALILKNLWNSWNIIFPETPFDDEDALGLMIHSAYISAYDLSSSVYRMKGSGIKGFFGSLTVGSRLSDPMKELLCALLTMSAYSGTGVKTALGMGKTEVLFSDDPHRR